MELILVIFLFALQGGSSIPAVRFLFDAKNTGGDTSPVLTRQYLWDLYKEHLSETPRMSQYDTYIPSPSPIFSQLKNFRSSSSLSSSSLRNDNDERSYTKMSQCENIYKTKKPGYLLTMGENSDDTKCRRTQNGWTIDESLFVDEPSWILVEENINDDKYPTKTEDPFYITRGKKSNEKNKKLYNSTIVKRETLMTNDNNDSLNNENKKNDNIYKLNSRDNKNGYVLPRDKHADILDILQDEPFFISRGKKHNLKNNYNRNRRGDVENLLKNQDPFYVARGRRTSNRIWMPIMNLQK
ncbi:hypothetical protein HCN44_003566 [Aphidius gifuensis]|uniref:Venom protein n=1 Tax=Aphidius gifuensis TaxID=684658 RepID=A0A834XIH8_APHGI|nr:uncharacterized protein LOC122858914 [Aphidius gifuensis]KAF7987703.1 hypothetical protein HCN44_003566 [Aphidius gifuensis]